MQPFINPGVPLQKTHGKKIVQTDTPDQDTILQRKNRRRLYVDIVMLFSLAINALLGIIKMPFLYDPLMPFFQIVNFTMLSYVHDISGGLLIIAVGYHIILSWKRFTFLLKKAKPAHANGDRQ